MAPRQQLHFLIENGPGPFRLVSGWVHMLERHGNRFEIELTVKPVEEGIKLLGHDRKFRIPFEVVLMGATTKYGHDDEARNARLLGRFQIPGNLQPDPIDPMKAAPALNMWQWEVVFNANGRTTGFVAMLDRSLPEEWTL